MKTKDSKYIDISYKVKHRAVFKDIIFCHFFFRKKIISHQSREHSSGRHVMWSQAFDLPFSTTLSTVRAGVPLISGGFFTSQK